MTSLWRRHQRTERAWMRALWSCHRLEIWRRELMRILMTRRLPVKTFDLIQRAAAKCYWYHQQLYQTCWVVYPVTKSYPFSPMYVLFTCLSSCYIQPLSLPLYSSLFPLCLLCTIPIPGIYLQISTFFRQVKILLEHAPHFVTILMHPVHVLSVSMPVDVSTHCLTRTHTVNFRGLCRIKSVQ